MKTKKLNIAHSSGIASDASLVSVSCVMALIPTRLKGNILQYLNIHHINWQHKTVYGCTCLDVNCATLSVVVL